MRRFLFLTVCLVLLALPPEVYAQASLPEPLRVGWLSDVIGSRTECGYFMETPPPTTKVPAPKPLTGVGEDDQRAQRFREIYLLQEKRRLELGCDSVLSGGPIKLALGSTMVPQREIVLRVVGGADLDSLAASLVQQKPRLILVSGTRAAVAVARATNTIPIVMVGVSDHVQVGLVSSLARPGGNVTGVSFLAPELVSKSLQLLAELEPRRTRVVALWNARNSGAELALRRAQETARSLALELVPVPVQDRAGVVAALDAIRSLHADGLLVIADGVFVESRKEIVTFATTQRLPTAFQLRDAVDRGGLLSYGPSETDVETQAAQYVRRILRGARPQDLPIEQPSRFHFVINMNSAKTLGLTIPQALLQRADEVIE